MPYDWKALAPTRPLSVAELKRGALYVPRPSGGALALDALLSAGIEQPIALFGPAGSGKSTELAALRQGRGGNCVLVPLDKELLYDDETSAIDVLEAVAKVVIRQARTQGVNLSQELDIASNHTAVNRYRSISLGFELLLVAVREIGKATKQRAVGLLVDGLEKAPPGLAALALADLARLGNGAQVVVVVPMALATGPAAAVLHEYHVMSIGPIVVDENVDASWDQGFSFLFMIAARRLGVRPEDIRGPTQSAMHRCISMSGGLIRTFLQLLQKAALYAAMRGSDVPAVEDVERAARDQTTFLLRLLKEGDMEALRAADGTSGVEVEIDRRVRFLAHGLLLEYHTSAGPIVRVAPLLASAILNGGPRG